MFTCSDNLLWSLFSHLNIFMSIKNISFSDEKEMFLIVYYLTFKLIVLIALFVPSSAVILIVNEPFCGAVHETDVDVE